MILNVVWWLGLPFFSLEIENVEHFDIEKVANSVEKEAF